jgi:hypothetical protein
LASARTTIELNGKLYDARSGKIISDAAAGPAPAKPSRPASRGNGVVLDGFMRRPAASKSKPAQSRTAPAHTPAAKLEKSKTLMRPAVKKPKPAVKNTNGDQRSAQFKKEDPARMTRASLVAKSSAVQRFNFGTNQHKVVKREAHLPVASPGDSHARQITSQVAHLATSTEAHLKQSVDVIEESLRNASAHLEKFDGRIGRRRLLERIGFRNRAANITALSFAGLLLVGFFAFQNAPNIEMRVAAARSGVSAHMPGYKPAGFTASTGVKAEPGKVAVVFRSNTDDKKYTVTQQASNWSSDSLLSNHVLATKQQFQTYQDAGKTVFIYDNSNATWVNGGIWYRVDGNASLTSDQLLRIANSL